MRARTAAGGNAGAHDERYVPNYEPWAHVGLTPLEWYRRLEDRVDQLRAAGAEKAVIRRAIEVASEMRQRLAEGVCPCCGQQQVWGWESPLLHAEDCPELPSRSGPVERTYDVPRVTWSWEVRA